MPTVLLVLVVIAALKLGAALVLPIVIAVLLTLTLRAPVRWLQGRRIPGRLAAAMVVFGICGAALGGGALLVAPATQWVESAPATAHRLQTRMRLLSQPITRLQRSSDQIQRAAAPATDGAPRIVQLSSPGLFALATGEVLRAVPAVLAVVFLTYFLLANGPLVRRKLAQLLPGRDELRRRTELVTEIEDAATRFLSTVAIVNLGVGALTALAMFLIGVPNPLLWGGVAALLNFVPYLGPVVTATLIGIAALAGIDAPAHALLAPAAFLAIHLTESNYVTPTLLGRHLPVNTVAIFVGLLFFAWLWGIPGAVLGVPLTVCVKLVCDYAPGLAELGDLLGS